MALRALIGDDVLTGALAAGANNSGAVMLANGSGSFVFGVHSTAVSGTAPTLDVKIQESDDASAWSDVTGLTLTQVTAANQNRVAFGHSAKKYVRAVGTVGGSATPTVTATVTIAGIGVV